MTNSFSKEQKGALRAWNKQFANIVTEIQFQHNERINVEPQPDPFTSYIHLDNKRIPGYTAEFMVSPTRKDAGVIGFRWVNLFKGIARKSEGQDLLESLVEAANQVLALQGLPTVDTAPSTLIFNFDYSKTEESVATALAQATVVDNIFQTHFATRFETLREEALTEA